MAAEGVIAMDAMDAMDATVVTAAGGAMAVTDAMDVTLAGGAMAAAAMAADVTVADMTVVAGVIRYRHREPKVEVEKAVMVLLQTISRGLALLEYRARALAGNRDVR